MSRPEDDRTDGEPDGACPRPADRGAPTAVPGGGASAADGAEVRELRAGGSVLGARRPAPTTAPGRAGPPGADSAPADPGDGSWPPLVHVPGGDRGVLLRRIVGG